MKKIFEKTTAVGLIMVLAMFFSCKDETVNIYPKIVVDKVLNDTLNVDHLPEILTPGLKIDGTTTTTTDPTDALHLVRTIQGNTVTEPSNNNFIDLATGNVYNSNSVLPKQHEVDLILANFNTPSKNNLITPDSKELAYNPFGNDVQRGWSVQNKGLLYRLENVTAEEIRWFNNVKKNTQLTKGVDSLIADVFPSRNAAEFSNTNSRKRLRSVSSTSLILFKSIDRVITSAIMVTNGVDDTSKDAQLRINFKTDISNKISVAAGSPTLKATRNDYDKFVLTYNPNQENFFALNFNNNTFATGLSDVNNPSDYHLTIGTRLRTDAGEGTSYKEVFVFTPQSSYFGNWAGSATLATPYRTLFGTSTTYTRFYVMSKLNNYVGNEGEKVSYSTSALTNYYGVVQSDLTFFASHISADLHAQNNGTTVYPYVARFAQTNKEGSVIIRAGVFSVLEVNHDLGRIILGYKFSTVLD